MQGRAVARKALGSTGAVEPSLAPSHAHQENMFGCPGGRRTGNRGTASRGRAPLRQEGGNARGMHTYKQGMYRWQRDGARQVSTASYRHGRIAVKRGVTGPAKVSLGGPVTPLTTSAGRDICRDYKVLHVTVPPFPPLEMHRACFVCLLECTRRGLLHAAHAGRDPHVKPAFLNPSLIDAWWRSGLMPPCDRGRWAVRCEPCSAAAWHGSNCRQQKV